MNGGEARLVLDEREEELEEECIVPLQVGCESHLSSGLSQTDMPTC